MFGRFADLILERGAPSIEFHPLLFKGLLAHPAFRLSLAVFGNGNCYVEDF